MVVIRLSRAGAKKRPFYHIKVTDSRNRRDTGKSIDTIGYFNPVARGQEVRIHLEMDKLVHWQKLGAQLSDRVASLVKEYKKGDAAAA